MEKVDAAIIGAGVVGLSIAASLSEDFENVVLLEKNESFGQETSSRDSEILHSALVYYPRNSLKAKLCSLGIRAIYDLDPKLVPYQKIGKLIVAQEPEEISKLESLLKIGLENGAESLRLIEKEKIKKLEPEVNAIAAIYSPETGIIDSHRLMEYFVGRIKQNSGGLEPIAYEANIIGIDKADGGYKIRFMQNGEEESLFTKILINSAGLGAEKIARMAGIDIATAGYELEFWKGEYFSVNGRHRGKTSHLIYPLPGKIGLGIHTVLDLEGNLKIGPNAFRVDEINYSVDESKREEFYDSVKNILPFIEIEDLQPDMSGIRPKLKNSSDFLIKEETDLGFPGMVNLLGIASPGKTAAIAIGPYVKGIVKEFN